MRGTPHTRWRALGVVLSALAVLAVAAVALGAAASITGVAGTGSAGFSGDGGPATLAQLNQPHDLARLPNGDVLVADTANNRIRRIDSDGTISTFAGAGGGDGPACGATATGTQLSAPEGVAVTASGTVLIANTGGANVVEVNPATGTITRLITGTVVGAAPADVAVSPDGTYLVADRAGRRIVRVAPTAGCGGTGGTPTTLAGSGAAGATGDGGAATAAAIGQPDSIAPVNATDFLFADRENNRIRRVAGGVIGTVAGTGVAGTAGDGGPATAAQLNAPTGVTRTADGGFLIADEGGGRVRRVSPAGTITTVAGGGAATPGDGGLPTGANLGAPADTLTTSTGFLIADRTAARIRRVVDATIGPATPTRLPVGRPVIRRTAVIEAVRGVVRVRPRGKKRFVRLTDAALVKLGSEIDTERGLARVTVASDTGGTLSQASVRGGRFVIGQGPGKRPISTFRLSAPLPGCARAKAKAHTTLALVAKSRRRHRRLWVQTHKKRFRTKGRYATGTVRGTRWETSDTCRSTRIAVTRGVVTVRDLVHKRTRKVPKGRSYTAHARR